ncbi:hypothetical protein D4764_16G0000040 [Takifugu flavidus]|uniref:Uncharacterized protein n=1 Tax=Takifugu flavidus TaxID=433684 RepID=A0A5C6P0B7_9TELE|nr:hypothetical protein D4764_16G0000040 [Takifugu flavidus]
MGPPSRGLNTCRRGSLPGPPLGYGPSHAGQRWFRLLSNSDEKSFELWETCFMAHGGLHSLRGIIEKGPEADEDDVEVFAEDEAKNGYGPSHAGQRWFRLLSNSDEKSFELWETCFMAHGGLHSLRGIIEKGPEADEDDVEVFAEDEAKNGYGPSHAGQRWFRLLSNSDEKSFELWETCFMAHGGLHSLRGIIEKGPEADEDDVEVFAEDEAKNGYGPSHAGQRWFRLLSNSDEKSFELWETCFMAHGGLHSLRGIIEKGPEADEDDVEVFAEDEAKNGYGPSHAGQRWFRLLSNSDEKSFELWETCFMAHGGLHSLRGIIEKGPEADEDDVEVFAEDEAKNGYGPSHAGQRWFRLLSNSDEKSFELWETCFMAHGGLHSLRGIIEKGPEADEDDVEVFAEDEAKNGEAYAQLVDNKSLSLVMRDAKRDGRRALEILQEHYAGTDKPRIGVVSETAKDWQGSTDLSYKLEQQPAGPHVDPERSGTEVFSKWPSFTIPASPSLDLRLAEDRTREVHGLGLKQEQVFVVPQSSSLP